MDGDVWVCEVYWAVRRQRVCIVVLVCGPEQKSHLRVPDTCETVCLLYAYELSLSAPFRSI